MQIRSHLDRGFIPGIREFELATDRVDEELQADPKLAERAGSTRELSGRVPDSDRAGEFRG